MDDVSKKILGTDYKMLNKLLEVHRNKGEKIVMTSGTFDLFHIGHMRMLAAAKEKGDILVVAVKSDRAAALKKEDPPVMNEQYRMETVSYCIPADYVIMVDYDIRRPVKFNFTNTSSFEWLNMFEQAVSTIHPDIFVHEDNPVITDARKQLFTKYKIEGCVQPRTAGISTTEIIDTIKTRLLLQMQKESNS